MENNQKKETAGSKNALKDTASKNALKDDNKGILKETADSKDTLKDKDKNPLVKRIGLIFLISLCLYIPLSIVEGIISSREHLYEKVNFEISDEWGKSQTIIAPMIIVPVVRTLTTKNYNEKTKTYERTTNISESLIFILPENLSIETTITPETRYRGIFKALVHSSVSEISGNFRSPDLSFLLPNSKVLWSRASMVIGIDPSSLKGEPKIYFDDKKLNVNPGTGIRNFLNSKGVYAKIPLSSETFSRSFNFSFAYNGSGKTSFAPLGVNNLFTVKSSWPHPSFSGSPKTSKTTISKDGFEAIWETTYLTRSYPQSQYLSIFITSLDTNELPAVSLYSPSSLYRNITRLTKYGMMFIFVTFMMMFIFEQRTNLKLHYLQYGVIGLSIVLFFLTVLSLSEHIAFWAAYFIATAVVVGMNSTYIYAALKDKKIALKNALLLFVLYITLYIMLMATGYALLLGTALLIVIVGILMHTTKDINQNKKAKLS